MPSSEFHLLLSTIAQYSCHTYPLRQSGQPLSTHLSNNRIQWQYKHLLPCNSYNQYCNIDDIHIHIWLYIFSEIYFNTLPSRVLTSNCGALAGWLTELRVKMRIPMSFRWLFNRDFCDLKYLLRALPLPWLLFLSPQYQLSPLAGNSLFSFVCIKQFSI